MNLIPNWRASWKFWSIRLGVAGTLLTSIFLAAPDAALYAWALLPEDIKSHMPPAVIKFMGIGIMALSFIARVVQQPKLKVENESNLNQSNQSGD